MRQKRIIHCIWIALAVLISGGCGQRFRAGGELALEPFYIPKYAKGFEIYSYGENSVLKIINPWQGAQGVEYQLFISSDGAPAPEDFKGPSVTLPIKSVVCMSTSHVAYIDAIGGIETVRGLSGAIYASNEYIRNAFAAGELGEVGFDAGIDYELIASLDPDIVFIYGLDSENSSMSDKLSELGINVLHIGEYVEQSPLGKAEWVVAFGAIFGKADTAAEYFSVIGNEYLSTVEKVRDFVAGPDNPEPAVMLNSPYRDVWYVPGDRSYMVELLRDAGARYAAAGVDSEQTRPVSTETAFVQVQDADFWLNPGQVKTMAELLAENPRFAGVRPVKQGNVYNCNLRTTPEGGSDFWESGAVRADIILKDLVKIFHPSLEPLHELYYFRKID